MRVSAGVMGPVCHSPCEGFIRRAMKRGAVEADGREGEWILGKERSP